MLSSSGLLLSLLQGSVLFIAVSFPLLLLAYVVHRLRNLRYYELAASLPGPPADTFTGHLQHFYKGPKALLDLAYPPGSSNTTVRLWKCHKLHVFISHPDDIEDVLKSVKNIDKPSEFDYLFPTMRFSIYLRKGVKWEIYRKYIAKYFTMDVATLFVGCINYHTSELLRELKATRGHQVDAFNHLGNGILNALYEIVLGSESTPEGVKKYGQNLRRLHALFQKRMQRPMMSCRFLYSLTSDGKQEKKISDELNATSMKVYNERQASYKERGETLKGLVGFKSYEDESGVEKRVFEESEYTRKKENLALIDLLIDDCEFGVVFTHEDIMMQANSFLYQGYETTTLAAYYFLGVMASHQDIQKKCQKELHDIFGSSKRTATMEDLQKMEYLERCIMETLRLFGPYSYIQRTVSEEMKLRSSGLSVPKGATIVICGSHLHKDKKQFEDSESFNPDNFLYENMEKRHLYSYIPFGAGPRSCPGKRFAMVILKLVLSSIMREFTVRSSESFDQWRSSSYNLLHKEGGFEMAFEAR